MPGYILVIVLSCTGNRNNFRAVPAQDGTNGNRRSARPEDKGLFPGKLSPGKHRIQQHFETESVCVVSVNAAVFPAQQGVDAPDDLRSLRQFVAAGNNRLFIGDGHIQPVPVPPADKLLNFVGRLFEKSIFIVCQQPMDLRAVAVAELFTEQSALHLRPPHCNFRGIHIPHRRR